MEQTVNLNSLRAKQARLGLLLGSPFIKLLLVLSILVLLGVGGYMVVERLMFGWLLMALSAWPLMLVVWHAWWLADLPTAKNGKSVDDLLDSNLLANLPKNASPQQIAQLVMQQSGGMFFAARFGIGPNFLIHLSSQNAADSPVVWQSALQLRTDLQLPTLSSALMVAALVRSVPNRDQLLAQLQLTFDDVVAGVRWQKQLQDLYSSFTKGGTAGGIGRDLSFGYTPLLSQFARNVSFEAAHSELVREVQGHKTVVDQLMKQLNEGNRHNAVLVGSAGVGKTTIVNALAERLLRGDATVPHNLRYCQVMALDPSALISSAKGRGELEGLVSSLLSEAYRAKNIILFLDNAELFFTDGTGAVDLSNVLLPVLEGGGLRLILSMDEQQFLRLSRLAPNLSQQLNRISVAPLNETDTLLVAEQQVIMYEPSYKVYYMYQALKIAYGLSQRYVTDQVMPGQALKVLEAAAQYAENGLVTAGSVEQAIEQIYGVKVGTARQGDESQTLLNLEDLLHQRMVNQTRAVKVVANALRRARSGVRSQNRPIGSFLFLGPTGVGKTELAKALAAVYFGGEDRMVRVDLNEFGESSDVARLIADASHDPNSLTAKIVKQPFSVVLLDEIEKAHPNVQNTLLQMIDEGVLRDVNNREASFKDAIIIATSNAGADKIRAYIKAGKQIDQFEAEFIDELIDSNQFKPEFINRFDETLVFRPLTGEELLQVVNLMLNSVNKTLAQQHIQVQVADDAKRKLVEVGNDPRLGARPLRRVVQRTVENIVAKKLLGGHVAPGTTVEISLAEVEEALSER